MRRLQMSGHVPPKNRKVVIADPAKLQTIVAQRGIAVWEISRAAKSTTVTVTKLLKGKPLTKRTAVRLVESIRGTFHLGSEHGLDIIECTPDRRPPPPPRRR